MERDAFGREKGEDSLAGMGWSSSMGSSATPTPTPTPVKPTMSAGDLPPNGPAQAWTPGPRQSYTRRRRRSAIGVIVPLFVIGFIALAIGGSIFAFNAGNDALDSITSTIDSATNSTTTTTTSTTKTSKSKGTSLMTAAALKAALAQLPKGDIELLRLAPDRLNANVIVDGKMHVVQVTAGGDVQDITTPATGRAAPIKVNTAAPLRIVRTAAKRAGRHVSDIDYLVLIDLLGKDEWQLYFKDGTHFSANANGKRVHKV
ncbi:hypothetical protein [Solirubrobacter soli]|uniref:hypothetical protein n=1 Tax=Solirubrobacter soli TaxID=363832 RepID=UPI00041F29CF|nr:hypothetical protein [Solirubrobacter soli]